MRLDLFLKKTALVRQRGLAKDLCAAGAVSVDGRPAKPSHVVHEGERIVVDLRARSLEVRVLAIPRGNVARRDAVRYIEVLRDQRIDGVTRVLEGSDRGIDPTPRDADEEMSPD
jgi:ribosomal 50S subunit-recycling heat shock protein